MNTLLLRRLWLSACLLMLLVIAAPTVAKPAKAAGNASDEATLTTTELQHKIDTVQKAKGLTQEQKDQALTLYQLALERLSNAEQASQQAREYKQALATAPAETRRLRTQTPSEKVVDTNAPSLPVEQLQQQLELLDTRVKEQRSELEVLDKTLQSRQSRPTEAREELNVVRGELQALHEEFKRAGDPGQPPALKDAQKSALRAQRQEKAAQEIMLEQELLSHDARVDLSQARHDKVSTELAADETRLRVYQTAISTRQKAAAEEAEAAALQAEREAMSKHPAIRAVAEDYTRLTQDWKSMVDRAEVTNASREATESQAKQIDQDFQSTKQKYEIAGLSLALGEVLREQRRKLPDVENYFHDTQVRQQEMAQMGLDALRAEEHRDQWRNIDILAKEAMQMPVATPLSETDRVRVETELRNRYKDRNELLERYIDTNTRYLRALGELDFAQRRLIDVAQKYATFLDERLLWMPSAAPVGLHTAKDLWQSLGWLTRPLHWTAAVRSLTYEQGREQSIYVLMLGVIVVLALIGLRRKFRQRIDALSKLVGKINSDRFTHTIEALGYTLLLALPVPLLLILVGGYFRGLPASTDSFTHAVGAGLVHISWPLFFFIALYRLCRVDGVAEDHFRWRDSTLRLLRRNLKWLMSIALPTMFLTAVAGWDAPEAYRDSLGRLAFITSMVAFAVFAAHVLSPKSGVVVAELAENAHGLVARTRYLWYPVGMLVPVSLALLAAAGYYFTARQLEAQLAASVWLLIGALVAHDLVLRWFAVEQRRLAVAKAKEKREAAKLAAQQAQSLQTVADGAAQTPPVELDLQEIDLPTINEQTRRLTRIVVGMTVIVGLWFIWVQVLPALAMLDQVSVWQHTTVIGGKTVQQPITLANLALAAVITFVMLAAARNLPGVLELVVLQRLNVDSGSRYAVTQILQYAIFAAGISGAFKAVGGSWDQLQWIVAALGVGLGFGLQEIFANFISGLILLFERPIKVGDTVTISNINGTVSRIRMRTTTITDWDRRALIVPNKTFITEQLINWSLDPMTRIVIKIGVAAGTDLSVAHDIIMQTARAQNKVVKEPEPVVYFMGVGEKTLNFELRVYVKELESRMPSLDALVMALHAAFLKDGVMIRIPP